MLAHCPVFLCYSLDAGHPSVRRSGAISRIRFQSVQWRFALYANGLGGKAEQRAMKDAEVSELSVRISEMQAFAGLIVRERNPENLEFPFSALNSFITSSETILRPQPFCGAEARPRWVATFDRRARRKAMRN